ncbi:MAG: hypothetical protein JSR36_00790 [Proteobacteria bacterium]|nr:hypothetical protein [Pseudomonadota bacterium]
MMPANLVGTAVALGLFVLAGGAYGVLYTASVARSSILLERASYLCYVSQLLIALAVCLVSPLGLLWKLFIATSALAYGFIPPVTWRLLEKMHHQHAQ